ncbi:MAG: glycosyltransferase [Bacteroidales bacterium]|nr:glycosyltransferase [Bacteroidales bacterium]
MKVCHISTVHKATDDRIFYKECISLAKAGYDVSFVVKGERNQIMEAVNIIAIPEYKKRFVRFIVGSFIAFSKALKTKAKLYHLHDPELIPIGLILKLTGKKVIYDMHEFVIRQIDDKLCVKNSFIKKFFINIYRVFEKLAFRYFDGIVFAVEGQMKYAKNKFPLYFHKTVVLNNYPVLSYIKNISPFKKENEKFIVVYAGGLSRIRGIKELIQAVELTNENTELWLIGAFEDNDFYKECLTLKGWNKTKFWGYHPLQEVYKYIAAADIGIALLYPMKNYLESCPVKSFEYMALGKAVIMSDFPYWKETYKDIAIFINPYQPKEIA